MTKSATYTDITIGTSWFVYFNIGDDECFCDREINRVIVVVSHPVERVFRALILLKDGKYAMAHYDSTNSRCLAEISF